MGIYPRPEKPAAGSLFPASPAAFSIPFPNETFSLGAGDGNRTHTTSLEGWDSTIELHPQMQRSLL